MKKEYSKTNKRGLEEIISQPEIKPEEKAKINPEVRQILFEVIEELKEVREIHEKGINGLKGYIKNPLYEGNGNGNPKDRYIYDVPAFYQAKSIDFFLKEKKALMAHDMGTGKSLIALADATELENRLREKNRKKKVKTLIICPNDMKEVWHERTHEYIKKERVGEPIIIDDYSEEKLRKIDNSDFIIASYSAFAFDDKKDGNSRRKMLKKKLLENINLVIADEIQNARNPGKKACVARHIKEISDNSEYLCLLSGTPIFNTLSDAYMIISLLEPEHFPTPRHAAAEYSKRPDLIRNVLLLKSLRKEIKDVCKLPELKEEIISVSLDEKQKRIYDAIFENDNLHGIRKLQLIKKALLDPRLLKIGKGNKDLLNEDEINTLDSIEPAKYKELDRIVEEAVKEGRKFVIFSPLFREGVTEELEKRYAKYGCLRLDGTNKEQREEIRKSFQDKNNKKNMGLVATNVVGEGISLTAASVGILLDDPYAPGQRGQLITRLYRPGQDRDVRIYSLVTPNTVDQGVLEFLDAKNKVIDFIVKKGAPLDERQKLLMSDLNLIKKYIRETPIGRYLHSPSQQLNYYLSRMEGLGSDEILKSFGKSEDRLPKFLADKYHLLLEDRVPANAASLYSQIIRGIEKTKRLRKKADLGSGPCVLACTLEEEVISVDLNKYNFSQPFVKNKENIVSVIDSIPQIKSNSLDFALCSLALDETSNEKQGKTSERERCLREVNRILKKDGIYMVILPYSAVTEKQAKNFKAGVKKLGFKIVPELTGYANSEDNNFNVYIATMQKTRNSGKNSVRKYLFMNIDKYGTPRTPSQSRPRYYTNFYLNGKSLDECLKEFVKK